MTRDRKKKQKNRKETTRTLRPKDPQADNRGFFARLISRNGAIDYKIAVMVVLLMLYGTIMVTSASYYSSIASTGHPFGLLPSAIKYSLAGLLVMYMFSRIDYHVWLSLSTPALVLTVLALMAVFSPLGHSSHGAARWIALGGITILPGEFAKLGVIAFAAGYIFKHERYGVNSFRVGGVLLMVMILIVGLIMLQPNLSTALTIAAIMVGIAFVAGLHWRYIICILLAGGLGVGVLIKISPYRAQRLTAFMDPFADKLGEGWQVVQSLLAIGPAGFTGSGLGNSIQKSLWLPEPQNDYILAVIIEETGFLGFIFLLSIYALFAFFAFKMLLQVKDRFGFLLGSGIMIMIIVQVVLNIAVVTSVAPPTGIILPFVSYGGTALLVLCAAVGALLNISRELSRQIEEAKAVKSSSFERVRLKERC